MIRNSKRQTKFSQPRSEIASALHSFIDENQLNKNTHTHTPLQPNTRPRPRFLLFTLMAILMYLSSLILRLFSISFFKSLSSFGSTGVVGTPPPSPLSDIEESPHMSSEVPPRAVRLLSPTAHAPASPSSSKATVEDEIKSSSTSLTELLAPATFCSGIFYSIPPMVQQNHHGYPLYELLLAFVFLGVLSSVVAVFCARRKSHRREAEAGGNDKESKMLDVGFVHSVVAFVLRILLQLTFATLLRVVMFVVIGCFAGGLYMYKV